MIRCVLVLAVLLTLAAPTQAQDDYPRFRGLPEDVLFAMPRLMSEVARAGSLHRQGERDAARKIVHRLVERYPEMGYLQVARAKMALETGDRETALAALAAARDTGQAELAELLDNVGFAALAGDPAFEAIRQALAVQPPTDPARPALIAGGSAPVTAENTIWDPYQFLLIALFEPKAERPDLPVMDPGRTRPQEQLLRSLYARGQAAGNWGDLYDNRDGGHSRLSALAFPQLSHVTYEGPPPGYARALPGPLRFNRPTIGNASLAITGGSQPRSLGRQAMTGGQMGYYAADMLTNRLYVYPEHRDHDPEGGDRFPANTAAMVISQGSSGSDMAFVEAFAMTLAAFRPDTKARLIEEGLIAPTLQMILRRTYGPLPTAEGYYTHAAHPVVFDGRHLNPGRMVSLANAISSDAIPPVVRLSVKEDLPARPGIDYADETASEDLFTTPVAIARIWRSFAWEREMVVSAAATQDPNGRPLTFRWVLLRGDPEKVTLTPSEDGSEVRIKIAWHDPYPAPESGLTTHRIDIAVIAENGIYPSAPAMLSVTFPPNETRIWEEGSEGPRLRQVFYKAPKGTYSDPVLFTQTDGHDVMAYGSDGGMVGWTRVAPDGMERQRSP